MNIHVNLILTDKIPDNIKVYTSRCVSINHIVTFNIFDYRLKKNEIGTESGINVFPYPFEEQDNHKYHLLSLYEDLQDKPDYFVKVVDNVVPINGFIDRMFPDIEFDENISSVYTDYYLEADNGYDLCVYQKTMPVYSNVLPLVGFAAKSFLEHIGDENPEGLLFTNFPTRHIAEPLCQLKT